MLLGPEVLMCHDCLTGGQGRIAPASHHWPEEGRVLPGQEACHVSIPVSLCCMFSLYNKYLGLLHQEAMMHLQSCLGGCIASTA